MKFRYKPISNSKQYSKYTRNTKRIIGIVIHDTGNTDFGANAHKHQKYLQGADRLGSAHYYVDDEYIVQPIGDSKVAWSVGDTWAIKNRTRSDLTNYNTISIEMCINSDSDYKKMYVNTVELVKNLMVKYDIKIDNVVRHFDVSGKVCPNHMKLDNWLKWWQFKEDIKKPMKYFIDIDKDCEGVPLNNTVKIKINGGETFDIKGFMSDDINYISVRDLFDKLGYVVKWNYETQTVEVKK